MIHRFACFMWTVAVLAVGILGAAKPARAQTALLDFESLAQGGIDVGLLPDPPGYAEDGYEIRSTNANGHGYWKLDHSWFAGSTSLWNNWSGAQTILRKLDGASFTLNAIDLAEYTGSGVDANTGNPGAGQAPQSVSVTFTGYKAGGGTVSQTFHLDGYNTYRETGVSGYETFLFSNFDDVTSVRWTQNSGFQTQYQFDNILVNVPEPGGFALLLVCLPAVAALARRSRAGAPISRRKS